MTKPTTDAELAEIRNILDRSTEFNGSIHGRHMTQFEDVPLGSIDIDDVRALVARLDAERAKAIEECAQVIARANIPYMFNDEASVAETLRRTALLDALVARIRALAEVKP